MRKLLFTAALLVSSAATAAPASKFLREAIEGDNSETRPGSLIASRGGDRAARSAAMAERLRATTIGPAIRPRQWPLRMHVSVPTAMIPEARAEPAKLQHMRGRGFDREVKRYLINLHRKAIWDFQDPAKSGERQTAALARLQLPVLCKHLRTAEAPPG